MQHRATLGFVLALLAGCTGSIGAAEGSPDLTLGDTPAPDERVEDPRAVSCDELAAFDSNELRRLSKHEVVGALEAVFPAAALDEVRVWIDALPNDSTKHSAGEFRLGTTEGQVDAMFEIAMRVSNVVAHDDEHMREILGDDCLMEDTPDTECVRGFIRTVGGSLIRRPLDASEVDDYLATYQSEAAESPRQGAEMTLAALMTSPEFIFHVRDVVQEDGRDRLDDHSWAARLSFAVSGSPPDDELRAAAERGELADAETRENHARRLLDSPEGRRHVRELFTRWLGLHGQTSPEAAATLAGVNVDGLYDELRREALDFVEHAVFEERAGFRRLMTSKTVHPSTDRLARLLGTEQGEGPVETDGGRAGLLTRPASLIWDSPRTSPIRRGLFIWERFLCNVFEAPDPTELDIDTAAGENLASLEDPDRATSRERTEAMTGASECAGCHQHINPPGFALARFGPLGEEWDEEVVYAAPGEELARLPLEGDDMVGGFSVDGRSHEVEGAAGLGELLAGSERGRSCAATQVFRATHLREPVGADACQLERLVEAFDDDQPIFDILVLNAVHESAYTHAGESR